MRKPPLNHVSWNQVKDYAKISPVNGIPVTCTNGICSAIDGSDFCAAVGNPCGQVSKIVLLKFFFEESSFNTLLLACFIGKSYFLFYQRCIRIGKQLVILDCY